MDHDEIIYDHFIEYCPDIHNSRLQAVLDVASALSKCRSLKLTDIGRCLSDEVDIKHRVKKVDRLESNRHLHEETSHLYKGLSKYVLKYINQEVTLPIIVDLCYMKDTYDIQMLSAEVAVQGRSLPLYREVFKINELKDRATDFLSNLSRCLPEGRPILIIMDAGFSEDWFAAIEKLNWYWLAKIRRGKFIKLSDESNWQDVSEMFPEVGTRGKNYSNAHIIKKHNRPCRIITKRLTNTN